MKLYKLNSRTQVNVNIAKWLIDWDHLRQVSKPQTAVANFLRPYWQSHVVCMEFIIPGSLLRVDFVNFTRKLAVEVSPKATHSFSSFFHKNRPTYGASFNRELDKADWLEQHGIKLIEIFDDDLPHLSLSWFKFKYDVDL